MCRVCGSYRGGHTGGGCDLASTLRMYAFRMGDLFGLRWERGATNEARKYLFRAENVRWRCANYVLILLVLLPRQ